MKQKDSNFFVRIFTAILLASFLLMSIGVAPASAASLTVTINKSPSSPVQVDPTNTSPIVFRVVFSQSVSDFTRGDVDLSRSTPDATGLSYTITKISGTTYNVNVTGMTSGDTVAAFIPAGVATAGGVTNLQSTSTDNKVVYETTRPTVTIYQAAAQVDPTKTAPITYRVVFSEPITGFVSTDVSITGTAPGTKTVGITEVAPNNKTAYLISVTGMTGSGTVIANIPVNAVTDLAGNLSFASTSADNTVTYDITKPSVTINQSTSAPVQADPTAASPIVFQVLFSEAVTGFAASDVNLSGSTGGGVGLSPTISGSGTSYKVSVTGMTSGTTVVATIVADAASDAAGNTSFASTSTDNSVLYDTIAPTVTINQAGTQADPGATSPVVFTAVFSEDVTGFDSTDVVVTGTAPGTKSVTIVPVDAKTYTVQVTGMTGRGTVIATINASAASDGALNASSASTSTDNSVLYQPPLVVDIKTDENDGPCVVGDCSLREAVLSALPGDTITFNVSGIPIITLTSVIDVNVNVTISGPGANNLIIQGAGGNRVFIGHAGNNVTISGVTISNGFDSVQGGAIYNAGTLALNNVLLTGNTAPNGGAIYNQGTLTISNTTFYHNHATSGAGIYNAATLSMTNSSMGNNPATGQGGGIYNASSAAITLLHDSIIDNVGGGVYNAGTMNYTSTVIAKNGASGDCTISGGSLGTNLTNFVGDATCSAALSGNPLIDALGSKDTEPLDTFAPFSGSPLLDAANAGTCPAKDERGVTRPIGAGCDIGAFEGNRPVVTVNQAAGQADPTASGPILFTVVFSEPVTGFAANDVILSGTATGTLVPTVTEIAPNNGTTYRISVTGMTGTGTVIASILSVAAVNAQGNANGAPSFTDRSVTYDVTSPTVTVNQSASGPVQNDPSNSTTIYFYVIFNEPVNFTGAGLSFAGSTASGTLTVGDIQGSGAAYLVGITGMTSNGTVVVSVPAGQVADLAGNLNAASTSTDNQVTYDGVLPTLTIEQANTQSDPAVSEPVVFTVTYSEDVTGFDAADVLLSGTAGGTRTITIVPINAQVYRVEITNITSGTLIAEVRPNSAQDAALNWARGSTSIDNSVTYP